MTICFAGKVFSAMNPRTTTSLTRSAVCCKVIHHPVEFGARLASAGDAQVDVLAMNVPDEPLSEFPSSARQAACRGRMLSLEGTGAFLPGWGIGIRSLSDKPSIGFWTALLWSAVDGVRFGDEYEQGSGDDGDLGIAFDQFAPSRYRRLIRRINNRFQCRFSLFIRHAELSSLRFLNLVFV